MAQRSATSSTTQSMPLARFSDRQMSQVSVVPTLPQTTHSRAVWATWPIRSASGESRSSRLRIMCRTARRAERGPRPGSLAIISIRASMSRVEFMAPRGGSERQLHAFGQAHALGQLAHLFLGLVIGLGLGVLDGGE